MEIPSVYSKIQKALELNSLKTKKIGKWILNFPTDMKLIV